MPWFGVGRLEPLREAGYADQLVCLPFYFGDPERARRARQLWGALSNACHAHPYDLAPTSDELLGWIESVEDFAGQLRSGRPLDLAGAVVRRPESNASSPHLS